MEPCWHPNRSKIDVICEKRIFEKSLFFIRKNHNFQDSGGPSWEQKSIKNRSENEVKIGTPSRLHFVWISVDLGSQVGAKLGGKIEPRQAKTGQDKGRQGKRREGKGKEEEGKGLEGKGVEKCRGGGSARGGGGVRQTLRGTPP